MLKETITTVKNEITDINNVLNKAIADTKTNDDIKRQTLRTIRNKNIETMTLILELEMKEVI